MWGVSKAKCPGDGRVGKHLAGVTYLTRGDSVVGREGRDLDAGDEDQWAKWL